MIYLLAQSITGPFLSWLITVFVMVMVIGVLNVIAVSRFFRKVGPEEAIVRSGAGGLIAKTGKGIFVIPILHRAEVMDLSLKRIDIKLRGELGLVCQDNVQADIEVSFYVRVNNRIQDILQVAESVGCKRASDQAAVEDLFSGLFSEALKTAAKRFDFGQLDTDQDAYKVTFLERIGRDLNGFSLVDCAIHYLGRTPSEQQDSRDILDPELQLLIERWPTLSKAVQLQIVRLVG